LYCTISKILSRNLFTWKGIYMIDWVGRGIGTRPDYLANRALRALDAEGMVTKDVMLRSPGTKYKRSKNASSFTSIALNLAPLGIKLLDISALFLI